MTENIEQRFINISNEIKKRESEFTSRKADLEVAKRDVNEKQKQLKEVYGKDVKFGSVKEVQAEIAKIEKQAEKYVEELENLLEDSAE